MSYLVESITVGEVGEKNIQIRESVTSLVFSLSSNSVSEIKVGVHDPDFLMHNNNYFMIGRRVVYDNVNYEISALEIRHGSLDSCTFTARLEATQKLRRETGQKNFGVMSPTVFAQQVAARMGLQFFGESSPVNGSILRQSKENNDESTMDVLQRLARDLEFLCFEAKGILFFASQKEIIASQQSLTMNVPSGETDAFFSSKLSARRTTDGKSAATMTAELFKNKSSLSIYPGAVIDLKGLNNFNKFMVDRVSYNGTPSGSVSISGTSPEDSDELACTLQTFQLGIKGSECVKRIQQAVGTSADGYWGPVTQRYVLDFQRKNNLPVTGIWDADDWAMSKGEYVRPAPSFSSSYKKPADKVSASDVFPSPRTVRKSKGWEYVRANKKLPPYPWNNGNWNPEPDRDIGYQAIVSSMRGWIAWLKNNSSEPISDADVKREQNRRVR
jgi:hypothetical protein